MAIEFDGTNDYVDCGSGSSLNVTGNITLAAWLKINTVSVSEKIMQKYLNSGGFTGIGWRVSSTGVPGFWSSGTGSWVEGTNDFDDNAWHHIAVTAIAGTGTTHYKDGATNGTGSYTAPASHSTEVMYLASHEGSSEFLAVTIEDFRIFSRGLSAEEISILAAGYRGPLGGEVGWWDCLSARGAVTNWAGTTLTTSMTLRDLSGNGNTGTPTNSPVSRESDAPMYGVMF